MKPTISRTSTRLIRVAFLVVLLIVPTGLVVKRLTGVEPYPALLLPSFGPVLESNSVVSFREPEVVGVLADGSTVELDPARLMPGSTGDGYATVFEGIFTNEDRVTAPDSQQWIRQQLARAYPDDSFTAVRVSWQTTRFDSRSGVAISEDSGISYTVDLGGAS